MEKLTYEDIEKAYQLIKPYLPATPLVSSYYLGDEECKYFFKLENLQEVKSFKIRGALSKMLSLSEAQKAKGIAAISSGNHGISVSCAAKMLGIEKVKIYVPKITPKSKIEKIQYFGAQAVLIGDNYDQAHHLGLAEIEKEGLTFIDFDKEVYAGQGSIAIEILTQNPEIDTIVVPIGGGGLITGIAVAAKAIKPDIRIIGVQTAACPAMIKSYEDGVHYAEYPSESSLCEALIGGVDQLSYEMVKDYVDEILAVSEKSIAQAVSFLITQEKIVAEAASCTTIAAVKDYAAQIGGKKIALVLSGGNIDGEMIKKILYQ